MSQRGSGYERKALDAYQTPGWVTEALRSHLPAVRTVWEPAAGSGAMVRVIESWGVTVIATDITDGTDFLTEKARLVDAIVTNPPYNLAQSFIEHALKLTGIVAMLLRTDYDHARGRQHLFSQCPGFARKLVLTRRIKWFEGSRGQPSFNHAWFIWDRQHIGSPTLVYGPRQ
jgi:hypothetical protein